ncbi:WD40/YVTN/BNR-like repeat-containing protein [Hymenobacter cellulosivorans]|uniref:YCF48-related protein n=1 Tax=Hymenobacter cellulosivorans TaxID=2932249 RepID=A0ABY4F5V8_9BACT|nr:YCF48-related protein [Hymenobacter cellulosivorans]UOQ52057.1 YCF48-related protein [Hymenobacter cellulosivorans]
MLEKHATIRHVDLAVPASIPKTTWLSVDFVTALTGYVGGENGALLSTDTGGSSWQILSTPSLGDIKQLHFASATTGLALTTTGLYRTTTSGRSWVLVKQGSYAALTDLQMLDASTGFLVGNAGLLSKTTDGGRTWKDYVFLVWPPVTTTLQAVAFASPQVGFVLGENQSFKTLNGGASWESTVLEKPRQVFDLFAYPNGTDYLITGTDDINRNNAFWSMTYQPGTKEYRQVSAQDLLNVPVYDFAQYQGEVVAVGKKTLLRNYPDYAAEPEQTPWVTLSDQDGTTIQHAYHSADFGDASALYAVGEEGIISRFDYR